MQNQTNKILFELVHEYKEKLRQKTFAHRVNFYDALKLCLDKLISGESDNVFEILKGISSNGVYSDDNNTEEQRDEHFEPDLELKFIQLLQEPEEDIEDINIQDISNLANLFSSIGEGLDMSEYFKIKLAIKKLTTDYPIDSVRFWGKVFGTQHDYYIIECQPGDSDAFQHSEGKVDNPDVQEPTEKDTKQNPPLPKSKWKPPPDVSSEEIGEGVNNRVYFVSSHACGPYTLLPLCQPKHIAASRMIRSYFTGDLTSKVSCWPPFPGTEAEYLRAQIARISSGTILAPRGFFRYLQEEEQNVDLSGEEDEVLPIECEENEEYVPLAIEAMELSDWVHSRPYILPQGRVTWINPKDVEESESEESENEENDTVPSLKGLDDEPPKREKGPPILTPISEDFAINGHEPWRLKRFRDRSHLLISSLLWPGAHTAAKSGTFETIYVGWGLKATELSKLPNQLLQAQSEILHEPEEMIDPTPEEEKCKKAKENEEEGEGEEEEEEGEEGEEDEENEGIEVSNASSEHA